MTLERIKQARAALVMEQPFYGCLALGLELIESEQFDTMATDGTRLFWNAAFVAGLTEPALRGGLAHEIAHCAYAHHVRRGDRDARRWNEAADYAINRDLVKAGFTLPAGALLSDEFEGMTAEDIYAELQHQRAAKPQSKPGGQPGGNGQPGGDDPGGCGQILDAADADGMAAAAADWQARVRQAAGIAKAQNAGTLPGDISRLIETLNAPLVSWRDVLRRFVDESATREYSWTRPNRRHIARGQILPGYMSDGLNHLVAVLDTSGSVSNDLLQGFAGELQAAMDERAADKLTIIYTDTKVQGAETFSQGELLELNPAGGGGTNFAAAFTWIADNVPDASAVLYFTDMETRDFGLEPPCPVLWCAYGSHKRIAAHAARAPFGETVHIRE